MKERIKLIVRRHENLLAFLFRSFHRNKRSISGKGNMLYYKGTFMKHTTIYVKGNNNRIHVENGLTRLYNCSFFIAGNNNTIKIESGCELREVSFFIQDSNGIISIGKNTMITGKTHLAVIEGKSINIGERCLFSQNISLRTGDSHSILNNIGKRINPSQDITIGNHVWIGNSVIILKGTKICDNSIVATGGIITGKECPNNSIIGGVGGNVLKSDINWCAERIPIEI